MSTAITPLSLLNPLTLDQLRTVLLGYLQAANDPVTAWQSGSVRLTEMQYVALGVDELLAKLFPDLAGASFFSYATDGSWVDLIAEQIFNETRIPAVLTQQMLLVSSDGSHGPFSIGVGFIVRSPLTGNRYYAISGGTLTTGAPNSVAIIVQAEGPNDPMSGVIYADGPNSITEMLVPWPGVTVTNPSPAFSAVSTTPSPALGFGVVTVTGTPPALATAYDFLITRDGQNTSALFQWRQNGGSWSTTTAMAATFAIPATSITVHFTNDPGGSNPSFRVGDLYSFTAPGSPITTPGTATETDQALITRCLGRWPDLTAAPVDKHVTWAKSADASVKRVAVAKDLTYPGRYLVTIAGAAGAAPLGGGVVTAVQLAIDQQESVGRLSIVASATVTTITATNDTGGQVTVSASRLADVQSAANVAWAAYVDGTDIGGVVRVSKLVEILMDAGAIDATKLLLNGADTNVVLAVNAVAVAADLSSLTWVGV